MSREPEKDDGPAVRMSLAEHLEELRYRIIYCIIAWVAASVIVWFLTPKILEFITRPLGRELYFTGLPDAFMVYLKLSLWGGLFFALPFFLYQAWAFAAPGLKSGEKKWAMAAIPLSFILFLGGSVFCLTVIFPFAVKFFVSYAKAGVLVPLITVREYIGLAITLSVIVGLIFQVPMIMLFLAKIGIVNSGMLRKERKYVILSAVIVAGVFSPTVDIFTQLLLAVPLILLYEAGIILCRIAGR